MEPHGQSPAFGEVPKNSPTRDEHPVPEDLFTHGQDPWLHARVPAFMPQGGTSRRQALRHASVVPLV